MSFGQTIFWIVLALLVATFLWVFLRGRNSNAAEAPPVSENLLFGAGGAAEIRRILAEEGGRARLDAALSELLVVPPEGDLLEEWRWLVGDQMEVFKMTVFGDMLLADPNGRLHWLDIGQGAYEELPATRDTWLPAFYFVAPEMVHPLLLRELRARGYNLREGEVYDWGTTPMFGGSYSKDNVRRVPVRVAVSSSGQLAKGKASGWPPRAPLEAVEGLFQVVVNEEGQYSMLPVGKEPPGSWRAEGKTGSLRDCLDYIEKVWVDLRPKSLQDGKPNGGS